ncbi:hypothetical protein SR41_03110 [Sphingomonas melonis]|uniref:ATP-dependent RNA helicase n=1 Tax=Sphingomonas melonis TaxID=152682 RepID=A0A0D1MB63_9SPHN|nr:RcnB family protein [Sphingomonas melonis]KIU29670.1 hypothetical protein SR41_03110 [Sphingomonas melonis]
MKSVIKALLAASMLMPVAVQAQEMGERGPGGPGRRGDWQAPGGPRPDGGRPPLSAEVGVDAQIRTERPQWRGERPGGPDGGQWRRDRPGGPDGQGPAPGPDRRPGPDGQRPDWQRPDRPDRPDPGMERRPDWQRPGRPGPGIDPGPRPDWNRPGPDRADQHRRDRERQDWQQRDREQRDWQRRQDIDRRWTEQRGWDQGWNQRDRFDRRNDWGRNDWGRNNWDRGWRNDRRYDWARERAANRGVFRLPRYYAPSGWGYGYRRFSIGISLAPLLFSQSYWIDDPFVYRLPEAYGPYRWVRYYDDALLVDVRSGLVVDAVYGIFY